MSGAKPDEKMASDVDGDGGVVAAGGDTWRRLRNRAGHCIYSWPYMSTNPLSSRRADHIGTLPDDCAFFALGDIKCPPVGGSGLVIRVFRTPQLARESLASSAWDVVLAVSADLVDQDGAARPEDWTELDYWLSGSLLTPISFPPQPVAQPSELAVPPVHSLADEPDESIVPDGSVATPSATQAPTIAEMD